MLPYILIGVGGIAAIYGLIGIIRIAFLPLVRAHQVVFTRKDDYLFYENAKGQRVLKSQKKFLLNIYITMVIVGTISALAGFHAGYSAHGQNFWLYKIMFSNDDANSNDRITEDGKFQASDGKPYYYYIIIEGSDIYFRNELCPDENALNEKLEGFDRTNTILIYDDFAVSSTYHTVVDLLYKMGIHYIEEGN